MNKKNSSRDNVNLFFSAFLIIAYIVCGFFFLTFINSAAVQGDIIKNALTAVVLLVFGLLIFYATRVGEGKTVKRLSIVTLIVLDLPALFIVLAYVLPFMPLNSLLAENPTIALMASVALGYGIPYAFISGFETVEIKEEAEEVLEGGIEEEISEVKETTAPEYSADDEEILVDEGEVVFDINTVEEETEE
ncbi:MAG: hypothetical protein ACI4RM_04525 [Ruminococcus sp.]